MKDMRSTNLFTSCGGFCLATPRTAESGSCSSDILWSVSWVAIQLTLFLPQKFSLKLTQIALKVAKKYFSVGQNGPEKCAKIFNQYKYRFKPEAAYTGVYRYACDWGNFGGNFQDNFWGKNSQLNHPPEYYASSAPEAAAPPSCSGCVAFAAVHARHCTSPQPLQ